MGPLYALRPRNAWHRLEKPRPQSGSSLAPVAALGSPPGREDVKRPRPSARRPAQLNQRLDVANVRLRPTGGTGEVPIDVGDGITTFRPIAVFSKGARKIELRFDASGFLAHLAKEGRGKDDERCTAAWAVAGYGCVLHHHTVAGGARDPGRFAGRDREGCQNSDSGLNLGFDTLQGVDLLKTPSPSNLKAHRT
jgi:hypothetical protein